ncbi:MAG TPA: aldehyde ferredoxin oxidoreductase family protein [Anaerolineales bacterium]|nr:aldehyde ferredoxin oxidoreductase family protein [Anaerolineales bacterium]
MRSGNTGKILRVDLTGGSIKEETLDESLYRSYPGGKALAAYFLLRELPLHTDPLSPENMLIFANGLLTGAPVATATRFTAAARSPLTGAYGESEAGGFWGPELKMAGYEAILITGKAVKPVYLSIRNEQVELHPADHLWGQEPESVQSQIRQELGDDKVRVLQIGRAGENLVKYASLTHEMRHYNGRNGIGAVMGSKNLKAVAVRGTSQRYIDIAQDGRALAEIGKTLAKRVKEHPQSWDLHEKGTMPLVGGLNAGGMLPTNNFRTGVFAGVGQIDWTAYEKELLIGRKSCYACSVRCKPEVEVDDRYQVSQKYGGPEYEAVAGFGSNCGVSDIQAVAKANELCNRYVMDTISTSATIAFAMECFERGLIGLQDTGGLELRFGNAEAMLQAVEQIAIRQGFGDQLAEGSRSLALAIGGEAPDFTIQVKGQELSMHDPRGKVNVGIGFAVSENGADHLTAVHDTLLQNPGSISFQGAQALGIRSPLPARLLNAEKVEQYFIGENWVSLGKALGLCYFGPAPRSFIQVDEVVKAVRAATGWDITLEELLQAGERATNLARLFNAREGFSRQDDTLPKRLFDPLESGPLEGVAYPKAEFEQALTTLYQLKGWDPNTGLPGRERLESLGLGWVLDN